MHRFHPTMLREYDIRGVIGQTLGEDDARAIGRSYGTIVRRGGHFTRWDLEIRGGLLGYAHSGVAVEEHGSGRQLVRVACAARPSALAVSLFAVCTGLALGALHDGALVAASALTAAALALAGATWGQCSRAVGACLSAVGRLPTSAAGGTSTPP